MNIHSNGPVESWDILPIANANDAKHFCFQSRTYPAYGPIPIEPSRCSNALRLIGAAWNVGNEANRKHILIVEDAIHLAEGIAMNLRYEGFLADCVHSGSAAIQAAKLSLPDLLLLDILLPDMVGLAALEAIRNMGFAGPVIILSGLTSDWDKKLAFKLGAVQYVTKPFELDDLIRAVQKALVGKPQNDIVQIDRGGHVIRVRGKPLVLTPKEFELLAMIVEADGQVVRRADLLREIWGITGIYRGTTLDSHIKQLRVKMDQFGLKHAILNIPKVGFKWCP